MILREVCDLALDYSYEKYISNIAKNEIRWVISMCDKAGHDSFDASISIDCKTGEVCDYSPLYDECEKEYELVKIPFDYLSDKGKIIFYVLDNNEESDKYADYLNAIYEKYDLYNESPYKAYSIINYFYSILMNYGEDDIREDAFSFIMENNKVKEEVIEESQFYTFETREIQELKETLEKLLVAAQERYYHVEDSDNQLLIESVRKLVKNAEDSCDNYELFKDELLIIVKELNRQIETEIEYILGNVDMPSDLLLNRLSLLEEIGKNGEKIGFDSASHFSNQSFRSESN